MRMFSKRFCVLAICLLLIATVSGCSGGSQKSLLQTRPEVDAYYMNDPGQTDDSFPSLQAHSDVLNEISPLWYHVRADGSLDKDVNSKALAFAIQNGIKVVPLVNLVPSQDAILRDTAAGDRAISNLTQEVKTNNYNGVNIDFEFIPDSKHKDFSVDRNRLTDFVKKMHTAMSSLNKETQMAVLPHVGVPETMAGVYDYGSLAPYLTKVTIMTYDHSEAGSPPGPVAPFSWVEQNITTSIQQGFKPGQICLGVATYGYDWPAGETGGFSRPTKEIMDQISAKGYQIKWSDKYQEPTYAYAGEDGTTRVVWFENDATLQTKIDLVKKYNLAGISIWRLGFEDQKFWSRITATWGKR
jgi:spore germination protein YaaH